MERRHVSWSGHVSQVAAEWVAPDSEEAVAECVRSATAAGRRVKVIGAGHSFSDIGLTDGLLMTLDRMRGVVRLDEQHRRVTVQAGIRLYELVEALARRGLALSILGSVTRQSIAGATSTGTHGSSLQHPNLAGFVTGMRLVTASGSILRLDEADERLAGARIGLGALGVITEVTLRCRPLFTLVEQSDRVRVPELIRTLGAVARSAEFVKIWWLPTLPYASVYRYAPTDDPPTVTRLGRWLDEAIVNRFLFTGLIEASRRRPQLTKTINRAVGVTYLRPGRRVGRYDRVLTVAMPPRHREMEYSLPMEQAPEALDRVRALIEGRKLRVNFVMEIRFVQGDDAWMSPAYGRDSCQIGAYMAQSTDLDPYFQGFEAIAQTLDGRPHWGKEHSVTPEQVWRMFPMADRFQALRRELDPAGTIDNECLVRAFGRARQDDTPTSRGAAPGGRSVPSDAPAIQ